MRKTASEWYGVMRWGIRRAASSRNMHQGQAGGIALLLCGTGRVEPTPKDRGAKPGDLEGPLACSLALEMVWVEARLHVAVQQAAGIVPWVGASSDEEVQRLRETYQNSLHLLQNSNLMAQKSSQEHMTDGMLCKRTEA